MRGVYTGNTKRRPIDDFMLAYRLRRWASLKPAMAQSIATCHGSLRAVHAADAPAQQGAVTLCGVTHTSGIPGMPRTTSLFDLW